MNTNKKSKEEKLKWHRDYMSTYRQQNRERITAQKNTNRNVMPDVFILSYF